MVTGSTFLFSNISLKRDQSSLGILALHQQHSQPPLWATPETKLISLGAPARCSRPALRVGRRRKEHHLERACLYLPKVGDHLVAHKWEICFCFKELEYIQRSQSQNYFFLPAGAPSCQRASHCTDVGGSKSLLMPPTAPLTCSSVVIFVTTSKTSKIVNFVESFVNFWHDLQKNINCIHLFCDFTHVLCDLFP